MKLIIEDRPARIQRIFLEHRNDIEFKAFYVCQNIESYENIKSKTNEYVQHNGFIITKSTYKRYISEYLRLHEVIAMIDHQTSTIHVEKNGYNNVINQLWSTTTPFSSIHSDIFDDIQMIVTKNHERLKMNNYGLHVEFENIINMRRLLSLDKQTSEYRINPESVMNLSPYDMRYLTYEYTRTMLSNEGWLRDDIYKYYKPYDIELHATETKPHTSKIVRQMAEVGNIRHIFNKYVTVLRNSEKEVTYQSSDDHSINGDPSRVYVITKNEPLQSYGPDSARSKMTYIYGHYMDVKSFVEQPQFHRLYDMSKEVQMVFTNQINGLVELRIQEFDLNDVSNRYHYMKVTDGEKFYINQPAYFFTKNKKIPLTDIELQSIEIDSKSSYELAKAKLELESFRTYLENL